MHFTRPLAALLAVSLSAHAAPSPRTSLTKRWCGFEISCHCHVDVKAGCIPQFDECGKQWFWPLACSQCGKCSELCVDCGFFVLPVRFDTSSADVATILQSSNAFRMHMVKWPRPMNRPSRKENMYWYSIWRWEYQIRLCRDIHVTSNSESHECSDDM
ncbi:hypothetical protein C8J57DRAFT_1722014 [Mycena rebaudengoi]|nr:hypothetical protein C8J57DRAFT_1722014 [Mycena rebaudengoi]